MKGLVILSFALVTQLGYSANPLPAEKQKLGEAYTMTFTSNMTRLSTLDVTIKLRS